MRLLYPLRLLPAPPLHLHALRRDRRPRHPIARQLGYSYTLSFFTYIQLPSTIPTQSTQCFILLPYHTRKKYASQPHARTRTKRSALYYNNAFSRDAYLMLSVLLSKGFELSGQRLHVLFQSHVFSSVIIEYVVDCLTRFLRSAQVS
jgi:hypothetical protein